MKSTSIEAESPLIGQTNRSKELALNSLAPGSSIGKRVVHTDTTCDVKRTLQQPCSSGSTSIEVNSNSSYNGFFKAKRDVRIVTANKCKSGNNCEISSRNPSKISANGIQSTSKNDFNYLGVKRKSAKQRFLSVNPLTQRKNQPKIEQKTHQSSQEYSSLQTSMLRTEPSDYDKLDANSKTLYISRLRQIGWVLGLNGEWLKDESAEFDSDEDQPPSPNSILK